MFATKELPTDVFQVKIDGESASANIPALVQIILTDSNRQAAARSFKEPEQAEEFRLACDALNTWRVAWRCAHDASVEGVPGLLDRLADGVVKARGIDPDEMAMALSATRGRARNPFGISPLTRAYRRSRSEHIVVLRPAVAMALTTEVANIARILQEERGDGPILLPVESLRSMLGRQKLLISGAIRCLLDNNFLKDVGAGYHTGRARELRFVAVDGIDYLKKESPEEPPERGTAAPTTQIATVAP